MVGRHVHSFLAPVLSLTEGHFDGYTVAIAMYRTFDAFRTFKLDQHHAPVIARHGPVQSLNPLKKLRCFEWSLCEDGNCSFMDVTQGAHLLSG